MLLKALTQRLLCGALAATRRDEGPTVASVGGPKFYCATMETRPSLKNPIRLVSEFRTEVDVTSRDFVFSGACPNVRPGAHDVIGGRSNSRGNPHKTHNPESRQCVLPKTSLRRRPPCEIISDCSQLLTRSEVTDHFRRRPPCARIIDFDQFCGGSQVTDHFRGWSPCEMNSDFC